jgi:hypothetical protein
MMSASLLLAGLMGSRALGVAAAWQEPFQLGVSIQGANRLFMTCTFRSCWGHKGEQQATLDFGHMTASCWSHIATGCARFSTFEHLQSLIAVSFMLQIGGKMHCEVYCRTVTGHDANAMRS